MAPIKRIAWVVLILGLVSMVIGYSRIELWQASFLPVFLLILWIFSLRSASERIAAFIFLTYVLGCGIGIWLGVQVIWMIIGLISMIIAWDLQLFLWRLECADRIVNQKLLVRKHLIRLLIFVGISASLLCVTQNIDIRFGFGVAVLLSLLMILGLSIGLNLASRSQE